MSDLLLLRAAVSMWSLDFALGSICFSLTGYAHLAIGALLALGLQVFFGIRCIQKEARRPEVLYDVDAIRYERDPERTVRIGAAVRG